MAPEDELERFREQSRVQQAEHARLERLLSHVSDAVFALDREWRITYLNSQAEALLRHAARELFGQSIWEAFPAVTGTIFDEQFHQAMAEQHSVSFTADYAPLQASFVVHAYPSAEGLMIFFQDITERQRAEKALRGSEEQLRIIIQTLPVGVLITDRTGRIVESNGGVEQIYRGIATMTLSPQEYRIGKAWWTESGQPVQFGEWPSDLAIRTGEVVMNREIDILRADGTRGTMLDSAAPLRDANGQITGAVVVIQDITERKRLFDEVQRRLVELDTIFDAIVDPMIAYNADGIVIKANPAMRMVLGRDPTGMTEVEVAQVLSMRHPDGTLVNEKEIPADRALRGETVRGAQLIVTDMHGQEIIVQVTATSLAEDSQTWGVVSVWHDTTKQERAVAEIQRHVAELNATINAIPDGYIVYAADGTILRMNDLAKKILGMGKEEQYLPYQDRLTTMHIETLDGQPFPTEQLPSYRALHGETIRGTLMVIHSPEQMYWLSVSASPIITTDGQHLGAVMEFIDITSLHNLQEQQKALLQTVSHDLRTPLAVIKGHAQVATSVLEEGHINGLLQQSMTAIDRGVDRMDLMIQDLVDVTRWEGGQLALKRKPVVLSRFVTEFLKRNSLALETNRVQVAIPVELPAVCADPARLERILVNLLSNALKYSDPGTPVRLRAWSVKKQVVVAVADQGQGIAAEELPHLFERFYRAKGARKAEGIGLGLYITRVLVKAHRGSIWVESEVGKGSTFYFTLPITAQV